MNAPRRTLGAGATLASGSQIATAALGGLMGVLIARLLGPADTGAFNLVLSGLVLLSTLGMLGLQTGATYYVSSGRWPPAEAFRQIQLGALVIGILAAGVGIALAALLADSAFEGIPFGATVIAFAAVPFALSWQFAANVALGKDHYEVFAAAPVLVNLMALILVAAVAPWGGLTGALAALAAAHLISAARLTVWGLRAFPAPPPGWLHDTGARLRLALGYGIQTHIPASLQYLNARADLFILNAVAAGAVVGQYAIAVSVTELGLLLPRALANVLLPRVASLGEAESDAERRMVLEKSVRHAVLLMPMTAAILAVALAAVPLVYGSDFASATGLGFVLLPGIVLLGAANVLGAVVLGKGRPGLFLYSSLAITPPTLLLYLVLVPTLEGYGAALASTLSYSALAAVTVVFFRRVTAAEGIGRLLPGRDELHDYRTLHMRFRRRSASGEATSRRP